MKFVLSFLFFFCFLTFFMFLVQKNSCAPIQTVPGWRKIFVDDPDLKEAVEATKEGLDWDPDFKYKIAEAMVRDPLSTQYSVIVIVIPKDRFPFPCKIFIDVLLNPRRYESFAGLCIPDHY